MKFKAEASPIPSSAELEEDFRTARDIGKVRLGSQCLYFVKFSGTLCLPYAAAARAWLRQEEVNAGMCCGRVSLDQFFLMVQSTDGKVYKSEVLSKELGKWALDRIAGANPAAEIGYQKRDTPS